MTWKLTKAEGPLDPPLGRKPRVILYSTSINGMSFFPTFNHVILSLIPPFFFHSLDLNQLTVHCNSICIEFLHEIHSKVRKINKFHKRIEMQLPKPVVTSSKNRFLTPKRHKNSSDLEPKKNRFLTPKQHKMNMILQSNPMIH